VAVTAKAEDVLRIARTEKSQVGLPGMRVLNSTNSHALPDSPAVVANAMNLSRFQNSPPCAIAIASSRVTGPRSSPAAPSARTFRVSLRPSLVVT
jgi:hypothetical protein